MSAITAKASRKMKKYAVLTREPRCFLGSFDFSWEQRKVSDLAEKTYGGGTPTTSNEAYWNGDIPWIQSSDVVDGKLLGVEPRKWITQDGLNNSAAQLIPGNSIAIITRVGVGKLAFMPYSYATSQDFLSLSKLNAEPLFTVYACYKKLQSELNAVQGTSIKGITKDELLAKNIMVPRYAEQQQIGAFFKQLDHLITLHQRKCANLCSPSQVVFSLLFATSTFSWEQRKLGEMGQTYTGLSGKTKDDFGHGQARFVTYMNVFSNPISNPEMTEPIEIDPKQNEVEVGDVFFTTSSETPEEVGMSSILLEKRGKTYLNSFCFGFRPSEKIDSYYLAYMLRSESTRAKIILLAQGISRYNISKNKVMEIAVSLPSLDEQKMIGQYFSQLDNLITLHQRECISFTGRADRLILTANKKRTTSSWEQRKFDEVFDCTVPNNTLSRAELSYDEGTVLNVHYGDVLIKYGSVLDVQKDDIPRIPHRCREDFNGALLQDGDVIIADTAEDETTGKTCEIGNLQGSAIVSGLHTMVCRPRNRMALGYLGYYLNSNAYHHQLLPLMQGIKVLSLSRSNIQKTSVSYPIAVKEQQLIAYYFSQLDNLITLHQRKPFLMKWRTSDANRNQTNRLVL